MTLRCQILSEPVLDGLRSLPCGSLGPLVCGEKRSEYLKTAIATNHCPNIKGYASFCIGLCERTLINKNKCNINMCKDKSLSWSQFHEIS